MRDSLSPSAPDPRSFRGTWARLCARALEANELVLEWASPSTLLGASPTSRSCADALAEAMAHGRAQHASMPAPLYPARPDRPDLHSSYREWFEHAAELDSGALHALAVCNPGRAVALGIASSAEDASVAYDDATKSLSVRVSEEEIELDVEVLTSLAVMEGVLPEDAIGSAVTRVRRRLTRRAELSRHVEGRFDARLTSGRAVPLALVKDGCVIVDPLGQQFVDSGSWPEDYDTHLAAAIANAAGTRCTCPDTRRVRAIVRPRSELFSFAAGQPPGSFASRLLDEGHCLIYELACPHAITRLTEREWEARGVAIDDLERLWEQEPLPGHVLIARSESARGRAVVVYDDEIAAVVVAPSRASAIARGLSFRVEQRLTAYCPSANLLFLSDEPVQGGPVALRRALKGGPLLPAIEAEGLLLGPVLSVMTEFEVLDVCPAELTTESLTTAPIRRGSFV